MAEPTRAEKKRVEAERLRDVSAARTIVMGLQLSDLAKEPAEAAARPSLR